MSDLAFCVRPRESKRRVRGASRGVRGASGESDMSAAQADRSASQADMYAASKVSDSVRPCLTQVSGLGLTLIE